MSRHLPSQALRVLISASLLLQFGAGCGDREPHPESRPLKVVVAPYLANAPIFIAAEEGYFAEQGIEVEFIKMAHSSHAIPALAEGKVDVLPGLIGVNLLNAAARGAEIRLVADLGRVAASDCVSRGLMARRALVEGGELSSPAQLKGRRVSADPIFYSGYALEMLLQTVGLTLDDIELVDIPSAAEPEALKNGSVDLVTTSEPWVTRMLRTGEVVVWTPIQQVLPDFQVSVVAYGPTLLSENPDAGRRFMVAYLQGVRQYNQGKTERNLEIVAEHTGLDRGLLQDCCWTPISADGWINVRSVLDFQRWVVAQGFLDQSVAEDRFWDPSFVEHACRVLDTSSQ